MLTRYRQNLHVEGSNVYSYDTHVATIKGNKLLRLGWWSQTTSKHINYVAREYGLTVIDATEEAKQEQQEESPLAGHIKSVSMVCAMGSIMCKDQKEKNDWNKRMISTLPGTSFPDNWDSLSEDEKQRRLEGGLKQIS